MNEYYRASPTWVSQTRTLSSILHSLNRRNELSRLISWAGRKRLPKPLKLYQFRYANEEQRLFRYAISCPRLTSFARFLFHINRLISSPPRYMPKGSAQIYRKHLLTKPSKSHSILFRLT
jgi:hypothetical protein